MGWQESFAHVLGTGLLGGVCFGDLCQVLRDNRVRVHPLGLTRLHSALQCSVMTSLQRRLEETRFAGKWRYVEVSAPVTYPSAIRSIAFLPWAANFSQLSESSPFRNLGQEGSRVIEC